MPEPNMPVLRARQVHYAYARRRVLSNIDLALREGEVVALLGANGAGKSTLLRLLLGLLRPGKGTVLLDGMDLRAHSRRKIATRLAYVPQIHAPPFPYTVTQVVGMGRLASIGLLRNPGSEDAATVHAMLERVGIAHLAARPYTEISGGERQLALIARALAQGARILILDEPATGLDFGHQYRLIRQLRDLASDGYSILMTTHHPEHAMLAATRVALMSNGRIEADGPPQEVVTPGYIEMLYGVRVKAVHIDRNTAFFPV